MFFQNLWQKYGIFGKLLGMFLGLGMLVAHTLCQTFKILNQAHETLPVVVYTPAQKPLDLAVTHLFGPYLSPNLHITLTDLPLKLEGIVFNAASPQASRALISTNGQPAKVYKIGDALLETLIQGINKDFVMLNNAGHLEKLAIPIPRIPLQKVLMPQALPSQK